MRVNSLVANVRRTIVAVLLAVASTPMLAAAQPTISVRDTTVAELFGLGAFTTYQIKIKLSAPPSQTVSVTANFTGVTAEKGMACGATADFAGGPTPVSFLPNVTEQAVTLSVCGDNLVESNETLKLTVADSRTGAVLGEATITIVDNDTPSLPRVFLSAVTPNSAFYESVPNTLNPVLTVKLSATSTQTVEVKYQFVDETATRGSVCSGNTDYVAASNTLVFAPGETEKTINVQICADTRVDAQTETFLFRLTSPINAILGQATPASGNMPTDVNTSRRFQIIDNDRPTITVTGSGVETNAGQTSITVTLRLGQARGDQYVLQYSTALNGVAPYPATSGTSCIGSADYVAIPPTNVTFQPNEVTKTFTLSVCGDTLIERDETLQLVLASPTAEPSTSSASGIKIVNDDMPRLTVDDVTIPVGDTPIDVEMSVVLAPKPGEPATVSYSTSNGSLLGGSICTGSIGFVTSSGTLSFTGGGTDVPAGAGAVPGNFATDFTQTRKFKVHLCKRSIPSTIAVKILLSGATNAVVARIGAIKIVPP